MPSIEIRPLGINGGFPGTNGGGGGTRKACTGWTAASARGNMRFLRSVRSDLLPDFGVAFTFTLRDLPTADEYQELKAMLTRHLSEKIGTHLWHMVTEWTGKGMPHLHGCFYLQDFDRYVLDDIERFWLEISARFGTGTQGQYVTPIRGNDGWFRYMSKHASRGFAHYQRQELPEGWDKSGRMWSKSNGWPVEISQIEVTKSEFYAFRRLCDRYATAVARSDLAKARYARDKIAIRRALWRLKFLKRLRKAFSSLRSENEVRGINEWIDAPIASQLARIALAQTATDIQNENDCPICAPDGWLMCVCDCPY